MSLSKVLGSLSNNDATIVVKTSPKKMDLSPFKLFCVYLHLLSLSIVSDFSCS